MAMLGHDRNLQQGDRIKGGGCQVCVHKGLPHPHRPYGGHHQLATLQPARPSENGGRSNLSVRQRKLAMLRGTAVLLLLPIPLRLRMHVPDKPKVFPKKHSSHDDAERRSNELLVDVQRHCAACWSGKHTVRLSTTVAP